MIEIEPNFLVLYGLLFVSSTSISIKYSKCVLTDLEEDTMNWLGSYLTLKKIFYSRKHHACIEFIYESFSPIEKHLILWLTNETESSNIHPILFKINNFYHFIVGSIMNKLNYTNEESGISIYNNYNSILDLKKLFDKYKVKYILTNNENEIQIIQK
jgi:hypothetical protein